MAGQLSIFNPVAEPKTESNPIAPTVELESLLDLAAQSFGLDFRNTYTAIVGSTTLITPEGMASLSFSEAGIELDKAGVTQIAACEAQSCQLANTTLTIQSGRFTYSGRYGNFQVESVVPRTVNEASVLLGLVAIAGLTAHHRSKREPASAHL